MSYLEHPRLGLTRIRAYCKEHPDATPDQVARILLRGLRKEELAAFAAAYIQDMAADIRRSGVRVIERQAEQPKTFLMTTPPVQAIGRYADWYADPTPLLWMHGDNELTLVHLNTAQRKKFRRWLGDRHEEWYDRGLALAETVSERCSEYFEDDWSGEPIWRIQADRRDRALRNLLKSEAERVRLETTQDLLDSLFALGDGSKVTWGSASVDQHRQRVDLLVGNASGNIEAAARHQAAIRMITDAGVSCLSDLEDA